MFESTTTNDDGTETLSGCYVVYYDGSTDNEFPMVNVRHILVKPAHPTDEAEDAHTDGETYSAEEWAAAKATAEITEETHTWAGWKALGYEVIHESKALYQASVNDPATKSGTRRTSYFGLSQVQPIEA